MEVIGEDRGSEGLVEGSKSNHFIHYHVVHLLQRNSVIHYLSLQARFSKACSTLYVSLHVQPMHRYYNIYSGPLYYQPLDCHAESVFVTCVQHSGIQCSMSLTSRQYLHFFTLSYVVNLGIYQHYSKQRCSPNGNMTCNASCSLRFAVRWICESVIA